MNPDDPIRGPDRRRGPGGRHFPGRGAKAPTSDASGGGDETCLATRCADARGADAVGNGWSAVVVARLLDRGTRRVNDLADESGSITDEVHSESPDDLDARGVVAREGVAGKPVAVVYSPTGRGEALRPVVEALEAWGRCRSRPDGACQESAAGTGPA